MRRRAGQVQRRGLAEEFDELLVHDLDDLLCRREAVHHLAADSSHAYAGDELLDDLEIDVRLQQRETHFAQRGVDIRLAQLSLASETVKYVLQFVG